MSSRRWVWVLGLLVLSGCHSLPDSTDLAVAGLARQVRDPEPFRPADSTPALPECQPDKQSASPPAAADAVQRAGGVAVQKEEVLPQPKPLKGPKAALLIPQDLPGAQAPPISWSLDKAKQPGIVKALYPPLPPLPAPTRPAPGPTGRPLTLSDLQSLATAHHPSIRNAVAGVEAAKGAVFQAGAYPNPSVFWEADTVGTGGGGYQGMGVDQVIKGANKLKLARAAAVMDLRNAELALRKAQSDLATQVRTNYFGLLVALENIKVSRALARFTDDLYRVQTDLLRAGEAAPYEPMQLRPLALQARFNLLQAQNQYLASWKQLAAALGVPGMPPTDVAGSVDLPVPVFDHDEVLTHIVSNHTDILSALNALQKARYALELAKVQPVPDPDLHILVQKDYTTPPNFMVYSVALTVPVPVWDQNRGNIHQAKNQLTQAVLAPQQSRLQLINTLADAWNRYVTAREQVQLVRQQIDDQVRVFRRVYQRHRQTEGQVSFGDVVTAQQTLVNYISAYITALGLQWQAVVDVANLLQTDDLFRVGHTEQMTPVPDLEQLLPRPCVPCAAAATVLGQPCADQGTAAAGRPAVLGAAR